MKIKLRCVLLGVTLSTSACVAGDVDPAPKPEPLRGSDCVFFRTLDDWQALDKSNLVVWAPGRRNAYQVRLSFPLPDMESSWRLAFVDGDGDGRFCGFGRDAIVTNQVGSVDGVTIGAIKHLDAADLAKLEEQYNTKLRREFKKEKPTQPSRETAQ